MNRVIAAVSAVLLASPMAFAQGAAPAAASIPSGAASTNSAQIREFQQIENKWSQAENKHNQYGLDLVLSPLLVNVAANGDITTHDQQIVNAINNNDKMYYLSQKVIAVRMLGDIAVVNGTYLLRHHLNDEKVVTDRGVFTHVYQRQRGGWMCVNAQRTLVSEMSSKKARETREKSREKNDQEKKSSATNSGFHIPFLSRGDKK